MFEKIYSYPWTVARHRNAPLLKERERFLAHCMEQGYKRTAVQQIARSLLIIANNSLALGRKVRPIDIERLARSHGVRFRRSPSGRGHYAATPQSFIYTAAAWFSFLGRLVHNKPPRAAFAREVSAYEDFMREQQGLSPVTIAARRRMVSHFLGTLDARMRTLRQITSRDVDGYLVQQSKHGWGRSTLRLVATHLRGFFRYAERRRWCRLGLADGIESPRVYVDEGLPHAPSWHQVQTLLSSPADNTPTSIRDRAVLLLLAQYGLRRGEVANLRLEDIDWDAEVIRIVRPKQRRVQHYPLTATVGNALACYLREARPTTRCRHVFLARKAPIRPLSPNGITHLTHRAFASLEVKRGKRGPHSLRHACARHLLARGFSLKEVGDQLGHRHASSTGRYAKVDLKGLRKVAEFSLRKIL
jgi:site-specific recombinase XerD